MPPSGGSFHLRPDALSAAARSVWAKHDHNDDAWLPLWRHMADSAVVAGWLWDEWVPDQARRLVLAALPGGVEDARLLAVWLAAVHDIGKATPAFACQVDGLAQRMREHGLDMPPHKQMSDRKLAPHGTAGQLLLRDWLKERHGWAKPDTPQLTTVIGGHHGVPPAHTDIKNLVDHPGLLRSRGSVEVWHAVQWELLDAAAATTGADARLDAWRAVKLPQPVQVLLSALVIMADWVASNRDFFPHAPDAPLTDPDRAGDAWAALGLPPPWHAEVPESEPAGLFASRFALPAGATIRPVQEAVVEMAREMAGAGMLIVEAPMGEGKTEAALAAVEILAAHSGAGGCFVALPTMATSNAMFSRLLAWLRRLPAHRGDPESVYLAHSKSALNADYARLPRTGRRAAADIDRDGADDNHTPRSRGRAAHSGLVAHHWLRGRKRGMLSSFVAGTIDQLLFAGLKSRHLVLRHLAVAGKVAVIDEAHAYDIYMGTYLDRVLSWLGTYGVPVVVLSATLPAQRRRELAEAYAGRRGGELARVAEADGYPLLTAASRGQEPVLATPAASGRGTDVRVERMDDALAALAERLSGELRDGGCAVVVRNTVRRVHETVGHLRRHFDAVGHDIGVTVAHARFLDADRVENDTGLLARFGPPDKVAELGGSRPTGGHVVVASQVVEQSLDIDFDLMVTDLAPVDLLLQRMGRLHRHPRGEGQSQRPERLRTARCLITGADWTSGPPEPTRGSQTVYRLHPLLRAAAVLEPYLAASREEERTIRLPDDISPLVQRAYSDDPAGPPEWQNALDEAHASHDAHQTKQAEKADAFRVAAPARAGRSLLGWIDAGVGDADDTTAGRAQVRDSEESLEILVVRQRSDGAITTVPWLSERCGGRELPTDTAPDPWLARAVATCAVRLPFPFTLPDVLDQAITELEDNHFPAWQAKECHWLAGELVLVLDEDFRTRLAGHEITYSRADGLEVHHAE